jgi:hypothetical protein
MEQEKLLKSPGISKKHDPKPLFNYSANALFIALLRWAGHTLKYETFQDY